MSAELDYSAGFYIKQIHYHRQMTNGLPTNQIDFTAILCSIWGAFIYVVQLFWLFWSGPKNKKINLVLIRLAFRLAL